MPFRMEAQQQKALATIFKLQPSRSQLECEIFTSFLALIMSSAKIGSYPLASLPIQSVSVSASTSATLLHFWSVSCPICKSNMQKLQELRDAWEPNGLATVAVHMPLSEEELNELLVRQVANDVRITEPLLLDNEHTIVDAFGVVAVPAYFLLDKLGKLCGHGTGEFGLKKIELTINQMFQNQELANDE